MSETVIKFTDDQMKELKELNTKYQQIQAEFGALDVRGIVLNREADAIEARRAELEDAYIENTEVEKKLVGALTEMYGPGSLDPESGEFTPAK